MRILFLARSMLRGGCERQLAVLATALQQRGHQVAVALFYADGALVEDLRKHDIQVIDLAKSGRWDVFGFVWRLVRLVRDFAPDVVHGYLPVPNILALLAARLSGRAARVVFGIRSSGIQTGVYDRLAMVSYQIEQYMARWADLSIANSHAGRQSCLQAGFPAKRIVVIPNGIDTDRFDLNPEHGRRVRQELGLHDQDKLVGVVGRLDPMKDHAVFFQAALQIAAARDRVHFLCVGDGEASYRQHLQELARPLGNRLHWLAARQAIEEIYPALDVLVLPSAFGEGFSNVLAEAMACGVPCVATDVGDSGRILDDARAVVPVHDAAAMARAIGYRLDQTVEKEAMRSKICDAYSIARLADRTENALLSLFAVRKC